ncbi:hypothetical protein [Xenorhabdus santafensis]|uniref:hypothetical protein n=1 Tax=Xenorhabdus santafensis TaxID=2582833 RepID=UPI0029E7F5B1|nr:hypothetical protein [Xenorhabdus sp. 12]
MDFKLHRGGKGMIDNRMFIKTVAGVNACSQQRGNLKDEGDKAPPIAKPNNQER